MSAIRYLNAVAPVLRKSEEGISHRFENVIFRLHNNFTAAFLLGASILLGATEFFGTPINCLTNLPKHVINTYCWVSSTFTISDYSARELGTQYAHPGVGNPYMTEYEIMRNWTFHNYYQWVTHMLVFQAALFYGPKFLWKLCEGGLLKDISQSMFRNQMIAHDDKIGHRKKQLSKYIQSHIKMHTAYATKYFICELLAFANVLGQLFLIDKFLGGEFMTYGTKVMEFIDSDQDARVDPMIYVFPTMTKCTFHLFGPSGTTQIRDALCLLPQNILNQKVFVFMWFWFMILFLLLSGLLVFRLTIFFLPAIRPRMLHAYTKSVPFETLKVIGRKTSFGDWWLLYNLASVLDPAVYKDVLINIAKEIETVNSNKPNSYSSSNGAAAAVSSAPEMYHQSSV